MRNLYRGTIFCVACFLLIGCQQASMINKEATEKRMDVLSNQELDRASTIDDFDPLEFEYINLAAEAEETPPLDEVIKLYFSEWSMSESIEIAVDIANREIYESPRMNQYGVNSLDDPLPIKGTDEIIELLKTHHVDTWNDYYSNVKDTTSYEDGASWRLLLQFADSTVKEYRGQGTNFADITPEEYGAFVNDLQDYKEK